MGSLGFMLPKLRETEKKEPNMIWVSIAISLVARIAGRTSAKGKSAS
jgi:hypothetical protein